MSMAKKSHNPKILVVVLVAIVLISFITLSMIDLSPQGREQKIDIPMETVTKGS
jgi:uncharacterized membrane protein